MIDEGEVKLLLARVKMLEATIVNLEHDLFFLMSLDGEDSKGYVSIRVIQELVGAKTGFSLYEMRSDKRHRPLPYARHLFWYLTSTHTKLSLMAMGKFLEKDHTSVIHGIRRIKERMETEPGLKELVQELSEEISKLSGAS